MSRGERGKVRKKIREVFNRVKDPAKETDMKRERSRCKAISILSSDGQGRRPYNIIIKNVKKESNGMEECLAG